MPIELEERDLEIMSAVVVWGVLGLGHVQGAFFFSRLERRLRVEFLFNQAVRQKGCAYRRLRKLELSGHLRVHRILGYSQVYGLTEKGHEVLKARGLAKLPGYCKWVSAYTLNNRLMSASVGLLMQKVQGLRVLSEREIYQWEMGLKRSKEWYGKVLIPDLLWDQTPLVALEVELRQKSDQRYHALWSAYRTRFGQNIKVAYLVPSEGRAAGLLRTARGHGVHHTHIYVLDIPAYRESLGQASFRNLYDETFRIGDKPAMSEPEEAMHDA